MAFRLPRARSTTQIAEPKTGTITKLFQQWLQRFAEQIEAQINAVLEAQAAADAAQTAADVAQAAAEAAQATADSIVVPPSGVRNISADATLNPEDVTILVDASGGLTTISLSSASGYSVPVVITKVDGSGNAVDVVPTGGDTLNGGAGPVSLTLPNETKSFVGDQVSQWFG